MTTKQGIKLTLKIVGAVGFSGLVVVAPNSAQALQLILKQNRAPKDLPSDRVLAELRRQKLIIFEQNGDRTMLTLTPAGAHRLQQYLVDDITLQVPKRWDKKWRIVTFDIPVKSSRNRQAFTKRLKELGFIMIQRSMWVHPAPCFEVIEHVAGHYNVMRYCQLMEVSRFDEATSRRLIRHFDLKI